MPKEQTADMAISSEGTAFGIYETSRIVVPGVYVATLAILLYWSCIARFFPSQPGEGILYLGFLFIALASGFTLYAKETPKRRKAFLENQPSHHLSMRAKLSKNLPLLDAAEAQRIYYYLLNTCVPPAFHNKIFFFGAVYYIMTQVRRISLSFALVSTLLAAFIYLQGASILELQGPVIFSVSVWLVYLLNVRYNKADRKMQENYTDQILWLEMNHELVDQVIRAYASKAQKS